MQTIFLTTVTYKRRYVSSYCTSKHCTVHEVNIKCRHLTWYSSYCMCMCVCDCVWQKQERKVCYLHVLPIITMLQIFPLPLTFYNFALGMEHCPLLPVSLPVSLHVPRWNAQAWWAASEEQIYSTIFSIVIMFVQVHTNLGNNVHLYMQLPSQRLKEVFWDISPRTYVVFSNA